MRVTPHSVGNITYIRLYVMRFLFYILATIYVISHAIIFQLHIGSWYGWLIGLIISWLAGGMIAGKLEPLLMHRVID